MKLIHAHDISFAGLWSRLNLKDDFQLPFLSDLDIAYSAEYAIGSRFEDLSFLLEENGSPILGLRLSACTRPDGTLELSGFGRALQYREAADSTSNQRDGATKLLRLEMQRLQTLFPSATVIYHDLRPALSPIGRLLLELGGQATPLFTQVIDLAAAEEQLRSRVQQSNKNRINWGVKNLSLNLCDHSNIAPEQMEQFRQLHIQAAGRETRSKRSWELQLDMIRANEAFLVLGSLEGQLVTGAFFMHSPKYCYYGVSASNRDLFEKPLGHAVLWTAILHSKKVGCNLFEVGEQLFPQQRNPPPTPKELNISGFKKGFGGDTVVRLEIVLKK